MAFNAAIFATLCASPLALTMPAKTTPTGKQTRCTRHSASGINPGSMRRTEAPSYIVTSRAQDLNVHHTAAAPCRFSVFSRPSRACAGAANQNEVAIQAIEGFLAEHVEANRLAQMRLTDMTNFEKHQMNRISQEENAAMRHDQMVDIDKASKHHDHVRSEIIACTKQNLMKIDRIRHKINEFGGSPTNVNRALQHTTATLQMADTAMEQEFNRQRAVRNNGDLFWYKQFAYMDRRMATMGTPQTNFQRFSTPGVQPEKPSFQRQSDSYQPTWVHGTLPNGEPTQFLTAPHVLEHIVGADAVDDQVFKGSSGAVDVKDNDVDEADEKVIV